MKRALIVFLIVIAVFEGWLIKKLWDIPSRMMLPSKVFVDLGSNNYVAASGSWISGTELANPVQASHIFCIREWGNCIEASGTVSGELLSVDKDLYTITQWNKNSIVSTKDFQCARYTMRFDRVNKQVIRDRITLKNPGCGFMDEAPIVMYLGDGLEINWKINKRGKYRR